MKAIVQERFGPPDILQLVDTDPPEAGAGDVLVRVHAAALNPCDWHIMRGDPLIARLRGEVGLTTLGPWEIICPGCGDDPAGTSWRFPRNCRRSAEYMTPLRKRKMHSWTTSGFPQTLAAPLRAVEGDLPAKPVAAAARDAEVVSNTQLEKRIVGQPQKAGVRRPTSVPEVPQARASISG